MTQGKLTQQVGVLGAIMLGLGSILGTGIFVSMSIATGVVGSYVIYSIVVAGIVASCNGLSSAQLAANHPTSGGTYEYGYRWLSPELGFTAGWMFLCAKSASAATAALGFALYMQHLLNLETSIGITGLAIVATVAMTALVLCGLRRSTAINSLLVIVTVSSLVAFVVGGLLHSPSHASLAGSIQEAPPTVGSFLEACALVFVAYTGYGRIATLGEEISEPSRNIPRAIIATLIISAVIYGVVTLVGISAVGAEAFGATTQRGVAPLEFVADSFGIDGLGMVIGIGAASAMLGVLLNLILGLSRIVLAMGRRGDLPQVFGVVNESGAAPYPAVILVCTIILLIVLSGDLKAAWSFSAFTVLVYYSITNLAALRLTSEERLYPIVISWAGLLSCVALAFWVEAKVYLIGVTLLVLGLVWHFGYKRYRATRS